MIDPLATADTRQDAWLFVVAFLRDQGENRLADDLIRRIAEQALGALVPAHDGAVEVLADDRVVGGFDDGGEVLGRMLTDFPLTNIEQHVHGAHQRAGCVIDRRRMGDEGNTCPIRTLGDRFHAPHRPAGLQRNRHRAFVVGQGCAVRPIKLERAAPEGLA